VVIFNENGKVEHEDFAETLIFLDDIFSSYNNKKLIIVDPGSDYSPSSEELQEFMNLIWLLLENTFSRIALVVTKKFHFSLGKMTEAFSEASTGWFRVFLNEQKARKWLSN
jgi:hypothetical protein